MKKTIKIKFSDRFDKRDRGDMMAILQERYDVVISDDPDYLFYSDSEYGYLKYDCIRIFYTGECWTPNFNECDYAIAFDRLQFGDRYIRLPLYNFIHYKKAYLTLQNRPAFTKEELRSKTGFCNFVVSNCFASDVRSIFFDKLSRYKKVDSGGRYRNNIGGAVADKFKFQQNYKFSMAFENCTYRGYCTEKIMEAFAARTTPIYYGDPEVAKDFNPNAFVNVHDFASMEAAIERVMEIDNNDELYLRIVNEPIINPNVEMGDLREFLFYIFDQPLEIAVRRPHSMLSKTNEQMLKRHTPFENHIYRRYKKIISGLHRLANGSLFVKRNK